MDAALVALAGVGLTFGMWWMYVMIPGADVLHRHRERSFAWGYGHIPSLNKVAWAISFLYIICGALRLARFNVQIEDPNRPAWAGNFFTGIPAPAGSLLRWSARRGP